MSHLRITAQDTRRISAGKAQSTPLGSQTAAGLLSPKWTNDQALAEAYAAIRAAYESGDEAAYMRAVGAYEKLVGR